MPFQTHCQSEHRRGFPAVLAGTVKRAEPAEEVLKIVGGDASEPGDPRLESAVIRVDVLDVPGGRERAPPRAGSGAHAAGPCHGRPQPSVHRMASL